MASDGLNSIKYHLLQMELRPLYTWILVSMNQPIATTNEPPREKTNGLHM